MFKKYRRIKLVLSVLLMIFLAAGFQKNEALANTNHSVGEIMDLTGILRDGNGSLIIHGKYATRAEFARMLVQASAYNDKVSRKNRLQLFKDVSKNSNYSPYIQIAVTNTYMSGYLNGKFKPNSPVTLKEAVYGTLTLLGYTSSDFSGQISDARFDKFNELGLNKNLNLSLSSKLSKSTCQILFYNLLNAKQKSGDFYGKSLGYSFGSNNLIDYQSLFTARTKGPVITKTGWTKALSHKLSHYTILRNNKAIKASSINKNSIAYYAEQAGTIWIFNKKIYGMVENITYAQGEPQDITVSGETYLIENTSDMKDQLSRNTIKKGSLVVLLLGRNDMISRTVPIKSTLAGNNWTKKLSFSLIKGTVYLNNSISNAAAIKDEDVVYYADELQTVWVFNKRIFGSLGEITATEGAPTALNVSGTSYTVEDSKKISNHLQKSFLQANMPVALLLGWDKKVYDVLALSSTVVTGNWKSNLQFTPTQGNIYKDGSLISESEIQNYDVVYYSNELKTLWVYDKKVYGILKTLYPDSSSPESVTVAGKTYKFTLPPVNTQASAQSADNLTENIWGIHLRSNQVHAGDNVVVLFGFNGYVADILPSENMPITITGYVTNLEDQVVKNSDNKSSVKSILTLVDTEGNVREYPCSDTFIKAGMVVEVSFKDGQPVYTKLDFYNGYRIPSDVTTRKFASDAHILEVKGKNYQTATAAELNNYKWTIDNVLYYKSNNSGEITDLIVNQMYGSLYKYGILKSVDVLSDGSGVQFGISFADTETNILETVTQPTWDLKIGPKAFYIEDNHILDIQALTEVNISYISNMQANIGDAVCHISDDVTIYFYKNGKYYTGTIDDLSNTSTSVIKGYRDAQGPIHIIIVTVR